MRYLNTDLDVGGANDLTNLTTAFESHGMVALHSARGGDGQWRATFEVATQFGDPASTIADMLAAIERLIPIAGTDWSQCAVREFNIGYECGRGPQPLTQALPHDLLLRIADVGVALRITIYPEDQEYLQSSGNVRPT